VVGLGVARVFPDFNARCQSVSPPTLNLRVRVDRDCIGVSQYVSLVFAVHWHSLRSAGLLGDSLGRQGVSLFLWGNMGEPVQDAL